MTTVPTSDCPAAHSMDTTWFAVDADGNVGVFDSGEAGGVPTAAAIGFGPGGDGIDTFPLDVVRIARLLASPAPPHDLPPRATAATGRRVVVVIDRESEEAARTYRDDGGAGPFERAIGDALWVVRARGPRVVATRAPLDEDGARALAADVSVVGLLEDRDFYEWLESGDTGVFAWSNEDYEAAGAYVRRAVPADPIRLDELPPETSEALAKARLGASFATSETIQLADHFDRKEIQTWGDDLDLEPPTEEVRAARAAAMQARREASARRQRDAFRLGIALLVGIVLLVLWRVLR